MSADVLVVHNCSGFGDGLRGINVVSYQYDWVPEAK